MSIRIGDMPVEGMEKGTMPAAINNAAFE